jgi:hypothetical protein
MKGPRLVTQQEKEDDEDKKVTKLISIPGGKVPPEDGDWLSELPVGTVFFAKSKQHPSKMDLMQYHVDYKWRKTVQLMVNLNQEHEVYVPVDPKEFCKQWSLHEIVPNLMTGIEEDE